jgi:hypothetical protein
MNSESIRKIYNYCKKTLGTSKRFFNQMSDYLTHGAMCFLVTRI